MTTCPDDTQLALLADDAIEPEARVELERHLDDCAACSELLAELAQMVMPARPAPARYRVVRQLGAGAMGVVWQAEDLQLARQVALKWVSPDGAADPARRARLLREARALAQLRHPNVINVFDLGEQGDELFLAMELVVGRDARAWQAEQADPLARLAMWQQVGRGLIAVHGAGIVHRDIKPENVLVADNGRVLVVDFGLATAGFDDRMTALTVIGQVVGTPRYMAAEQLVGGAATAASDQFALCVCMWEALVGRRPFAGETAAALSLAMRRRLDVPVVHGVERRVLDAIARGLAADPARRWPSVAALLEAIDQRPARSRTRLAIAGIASASVVALGLALWSTASSAPTLPAVPSNAGPPPPRVDVLDAGVRQPQLDQPPAPTATRHHKHVPTQTATKPAATQLGDHLADPFVR